MTTKLEGPLKRELVVRGVPHTLTISPEGLNLAPKGRRKGYALAWADLVSGEAALATALNASLARGPKVSATAEQKPIAASAKRRQRPKAKKVKGARRS
jgi:hypothetical protein